MSTATLERRPTASSPNPNRHPVKARTFLAEVLDAGWSAAFQRGEDTGGSPYATVHGRSRDGSQELILTWHTRSTKTYRLFSAIHKSSTRAAHDVTLKEAQGILREHTDDWSEPTPIG